MRDHSTLNWRVECWSEIWLFGWSGERIGQSRMLSMSQVVEMTCIMKFNIIRQDQTRLLASICIMITCENKVVLSHETINRQ